eukprot:GHUV01000621.1.p1 GENE.GHUV01000621.1~~GHUV01000621.1.p1  ORF type:complete len:223 (+),score=49.36 GHUV01000621.1:284-952(+)
MATHSRSRVQLPSQLQAVEDLLLWHDVIKSAGVLTAATLLYIVLEWSKVPLAVWISNFAMISVIGCQIWAFIAKFAQRTGPETHLPGLFRTGLDETTVRTLAEKTCVAANQGLAFLRRILTGEDMVLTVKTLIVLYAVKIVGRLITPIGFLYTVILGLFTLPKVYEMRKDEIDSAVIRARDVSAKQIETAKIKANEVISRLTPQKSARPAASDISSSFTKDE